MFTTRQDLIKSYINFFKKKGHKEIPSSSLIPENDPTVLFTTAGMHPLVPYLLGQKHPLGKQLVSVQKCIRTVDIDEVGNATHHTFFEMLGNWSLGDYFKKGAIEYSFEFLTKVLKLPKEALAVSVFAGDKDAPKDEESAKVWHSLGIPKERIAYLPKSDNWWGPAGASGPCGPDTEMFFWASKEKPPSSFDPKNKNWVEIWNDVLMEYVKIETKTILVDAINCLIDKEKGLNKELAEHLKNTNKRIIVVTNASKEDIKNKIKDYNFEIYTLNNNPSKDNPKYFDKLISELNINPETALYFDHKKENIESARKSGFIITELYKNNKKIFDFIENNKAKYLKAPQQNVDTGMGVERTLAVLNNLEDNYETSIFKPIIKKIEVMSEKFYADYKREMRIIADHLRSAVFILGDERGIKPSNTEQGYVLRRLIRRAIRYGKLLGIKDNFTIAVAKVMIPIYPDYPELKRNQKTIFAELEAEETKFNQTLEVGLKKFSQLTLNKSSLSGKDAFLLFQSYGFPIEMTQELAKEKNITLDFQEFKKEFEKHQELSRTASSGAFKSGLSDNSEKTTRLHTATHLLNEALRIILKDKSIKQKGSNITPERLRFDFNFPRKLTNKEIKQIEQFVNKKISDSLAVIREELPLQKAIKSGAQSEFGAKYPAMVSTYTVIDKKEKSGFFSKEICTGPHVKNTSEIGKFRIIKEESVASGVRRIKAVVE